MRRTLVLCLVLPAAPCLAPSAHGAPLPRCAGPVEIAHAKVVRVERNGVLVLSDGRAVTLEGIRLQRARPGLLEAQVAPQALAAIRDMTAAGDVTFTAARPKEDRYDRVRSQAFAGGTWLQAALLERGLARVALSPDRGECAAELEAAEARGRTGQAGLWAAGGDAHYRVRGPQDMQGTAGTFQVVEGWVTNVGRSGERTFIDFGADRQLGFSAAIAPQDRARFRGFDLQALIARHVRMRGMVQDRRGRLEMALSSPAQIEILN
jgi:endonuclease YncB( thermonuclease family)